jgi:hypothetical protein
MSLQSDSGNGKFMVNEEFLLEIIEGISYPPYRRVGTRFETSSISIIQNNGSLKKYWLTIEMPKIEMVFHLNNSKFTYSKYLEPQEYNVSVQSQF